MPTAPKLPKGNVPSHHAPAPQIGQPINFFSLTKEVTPQLEKTVELTVDDAVFSALMRAPDFIEQALAVDDVAIYAEKYLTHAQRRVIGLSTDGPDPIGFPPIPFYGKVVKLSTKIFVDVCAVKTYWVDCPYPFEQLVAFAIMRNEEFQKLLDAINELNESDTNSLKEEPYVDEDGKKKKD